jgi:tetratricopeptide (TPR) repeat protein
LPESTNVRLAAKFLSVVILGIACSALPCRAQAHAATTNAKVKADSLSVYSQMDSSSSVVTKLKKGQGLVLNFQIAGATGSWCSVRLPAKSATLGYVQCAGLQIARPKPGPVTGSVYPMAGGVVEGGGNGGRRRLRVRIPPPVARFLSSYSEVKALVVPQGELDEPALQRLDTAARGGSARAMDRAALGHLAAAYFQLEHSDTDDAIDQLNSALHLSSRNEAIRLISLMDLGYVHLVRGEYSEALGPLDRARTLVPDSAAVAAFTGWAYYGLDETNKAIAEWKRAQRIQPSPAVAALLAKTERDEAAEKNFQKQENNHFILRYEGGEAPGLAGQILSTLEGDFETLESTFQYTPPEPIAVILYTNRTFRDVTRAPRWADGLNDGRIRIPTQGLSSVDSNLAHVLMHELTHSFVRQMTEGRCPTWLNEGLAQYMEGRRSAATAKTLVSLYEKKKYISFSRLGGSWTRFPTPLAAYAYAWSLAAVESIIANSGMYGIDRMFIRLKEENSVQTAMEMALQLNYSDLELQTVQYLRKTYLQQ